MTREWSGSKDLRGSSERDICLFTQTVEFCVKVPGGSWVVLKVELLTHVFCEGRAKHMSSYTGCTSLSNVSHDQGIWCELPLGVESDNDKSLKLQQKLHSIKTGHRQIWFSKKKKLRLWCKQEVWLPRITTEILASPGRCPYGAVSPDREVLQKTTFVREEQYLTSVKVELEVMASHPADCMCVESKVVRGVKSKVESPLEWIKQVWGCQGQSVNKWVSLQYVS